MEDIACDRIRDGAGGASNVLLVAPFPRAVDGEACIALLGSGTVAGDRVLSVTYTQSAAARVAVWDRHADARPDRATVVSVGGDAGSRFDPDSAGVGDVAVETVGDAGDLTGLGVTITAQFDEWDAGAEVRLCFHSVTALLQYADLERAVRFLRALADLVHAANGLAHYHVQSGAHDERTLETLTPVFDAVVDVTDRA